MSVAAPVHEHDLTTYGCPLHYLKARQALARLAPGERAVFLFAPGESADQVRSSLAEDGHTVLEVDAAAERIRVVVEKGPEL